MKRLIWLRSPSWSCFRSRRSSGSLVAFWGLVCVLAFAWQTGFAQQESPQNSSEPAPVLGQVGPELGVLTSINGDQFEGLVKPIQSVGEIEWQGIKFYDSLQFRLGAIRSIKFPKKGKEIDFDGPFSFELTTGDLIRGNLLGLNDQTVEIVSDSIGRISIRRDLLRLVHRIDGDSVVTFSALRGMDGWQNQRLDGDWVEDGDAIETRVAGAVICGDLEVPRRAVVDLELSWSGKPDFVFALGIDPRAKSDDGRDGWRLETAADDLVILREGEERADLRAVADLGKLNRLRLMVYLDQDRGTMEVLDPGGKLLGKISLRDNSEVVPHQNSFDSSGIRILNRGTMLRLERLHVSRWVGGIPNRDAGGQASIALSDSSMVSGRVIRIDPVGNRLEMLGDSENSVVDFRNVVAIRFAPSIVDTDPGQCGFFLRGGMRLSGQLLGIDNHHWILGGDHYREKVYLPHASIRSFVVFQSDAANHESKPVLGRVGRLELGSDRSSGRVVGSPVAAASGTATSATATPDAFPFRWHPLDSQTSARVRSDVIGKIVYRDPPKIDTQSAAARMLAQQRLRRQQQQRGLNFGELFLQRADLSKESVVKRDAHILHLRSGDVIACRVDAITDGGVSLSTLRADRGFVPHQKLKAIEFVSNSPPPNIEEAKRQRLLTIPRLQKSAPPTHMLCSHNGDFLRCRLLGTKDSMFRIEVQSEEILVPRERVAQIIWFHDEETEQLNETFVDSIPISDAPSPRKSVNETVPEESIVNGYRGLVQVLLTDGKRVTFNPRGVRDGAIEGINPWIGECRFDFNGVDQVVIGDQITKEVADVAYNQWRLQPAVEPLVAAAMRGNSAKLAGTQSPLVGEPAPEVRLELLGGETFDLSECRGQVLVLDFWASWCAPCIKTMPMLAEAMMEFDSDQVRLVSINLQESTKQIQTVLQRHQIRTVVALDRDGITAQKFHATAIPQLVIIGKDGKVERLYVGGGSAVVESMQRDLRELLSQD